MKSTKRVWIGAGFLGLGLGVYFSVCLWYQTRTWKLVDVPISMTPGPIETQEISSNMSAFYRIKIVFNTRGGLPPETIDCLIGASLTSSPCAQKSVIKARWELTDDGKVVGQGPGKYCCGQEYSEGTIAKEIGSFHARKGKQYKLDVDLLEDGRALAGADPHLTVEEGGDEAETGSVVVFLLLLPCGGAAFIGFVLIVPTMIRRKGSNLSLKS